MARVKVPTTLPTGEKVNIWIEVNGNKVFIAWRNQKYLHAIRKFVQNGVDDYYTFKKKWNLDTEAVGFNGNAILRKKREYGWVAVCIDKKTLTSNKREKVWLVSGNLWLENAFGKSYRIIAWKNFKYAWLTKIAVETTDIEELISFCERHNLADIELFTSHEYSIEIVKRPEEYGIIAVALPTYIF